MKSNVERKTMSARDVAVYLGVSAQTAYTLLHSENFPGFRVRKRLLVTREDLDQWVQEQQKKGVC